jgi:hypothetical protein
MGAVRNVPAMVKAFTTFDPQGTGYVTVAAFREIFEKVGDIPSPPEIVDDLVAFADPEETGQVRAPGGEGEHHSGMRGERRERREAPDGGRGGLIDDTALPHPSSFPTPLPCRSTTSPL